MTINPTTMKPKPNKTRSEKPTSEEDPDLSSDYAFKITSTAVSQICQSTGFKTVQLSALETLTHVATLHLQTLAKTAASYSNASNRTQSNIFDIINALHDLSSVQGFTGASALHCSSSTGIGLLRSSVIKDLKSFVCFTDEIPFAKPIRRGNSISLKKNSIQIPFELDCRGLHIPRWLPRFPDGSSYKKLEERWEKRREADLVLWENSNLVSGGIRNGKECQVEDERRRRSAGGDLAMERGRMRFKLERHKN